MNHNLRFSTGLTRSFKQSGQMDVLLGIPDGNPTRSSFSEIKSFAKKFASGFDLGSNKVRMGVFSYSDRGRSVMQVRSGTSSSAIEGAIDNMRNRGGGNRKDVAIQYGSQMFDGSARSGVPKKLVLLTHGASTSGSRDLSLISESYPDMEIHPVAVGAAAQLDAGLISDDFQYYEDFPELVSSGPFEITSKISEGVSTGGVVTGKF